MLISEFIERTGFTPTGEEFQRIEEAYYSFYGDKDAFCKAFVDGNGVREICSLRAEKIDQLKRQLFESDHTIKSITAQYEVKVKNLQSRLEAIPDQKSLPKVDKHTAAVVLEDELFGLTQDMRKARFSMDALFSNMISYEDIAKSSYDDLLVSAMFCTTQIEILGDYLMLISQKVAALYTLCSEQVA